MPCAIGLSLFQFYGYLSQQQNMMQDYVRTGTYQRAILQNHTDFKDKVSRQATSAPLPLPSGCARALLPQWPLLFSSLLIDFVFSVLGL